MKEIFKHINFRHYQNGNDVCMKKWRYDMGWDNETFSTTPHPYIDTILGYITEPVPCHRPCQYVNYKPSPPSLREISAYRYMSSPKHITKRKDEWYTTRDIPPKIWYSNWAETRRQWRNQKIQHRYVNLYTCTCAPCKSSIKTLYKPYKYQYF
jgi:hypothetical protein